MPEKTQSFANHTKIVPLYHGVVFVALVVNLGWSITKLIRTPSVDAGVGVVMAIALFILTFFVRVFALTVQDRVIRLEMRLKMREVLPVDLQSRIGDFTPGQLVALRFASDAELPGLAAQVLRDGIEDKSAIKKLITNWQADHLRA